MKLLTFKLFRQSIESTLSGAILKLDKYLYKKQGEYNEKSFNRYRCSK